MPAAWSFMSLASLAAVAFIGTVFWVASPEAATALAGAQHRWSPLAIGLAAAGGQSVALVGLYFFGAQLRRRWRWFDRQCQRARARSALGTERYATGAVVTAGLLGFPPVSITAALLPGVAPRPLRLLPLMLLLRLVRFVALGWAGSRFGWHLPW
jgi:membrane protein YqaA with SNARE-associated domain